MPIGAIVGSAVIGAGASLASSHSNSHAIDQASQTQAQSSAQQIALQRQIYQQNTQNLSPFMQRGNRAGAEYNALLGLGGTGATANSPAQGPSQAAVNAYNLFKKSTGYQTRLTEGERALSSNYFGGGVGQSGAAMKAALKYGQNFASNEFGNYLSELGNQQGVGLSAASALAGVSQNYANSANNISQNNATVQGQAAIAGAQNQGALWSGLAGIAGQTAGSLSSYQQPAYNYAALTPSVTQAMNENPAIF